MDDRTDDRTDLPGTSRRSRRRSRSRLAVAAAVGLVLAPFVPALTGSPAQAATAALPRWATTSAAAVAVPSSIDATGGRDVAAALSTFLAAVPDGSVVAFAPGGRYRVDQRVVVRGKTGLTLDGRGATLVATTPGDANRSHLRIESSSRIAVTNLAVRGANPDAGRGDRAYQASKAHQHAFDVRSSKDVALVGVTASDTYGDFVYLGTLGKGHPWTTGAVVRDSTFARNGRQGVAVVAARDVLIERNRFDEMRRATFDLEPGAAHQGVQRVTIRDNDVGRGRLMFVAAAGKGQVDDVVVENNRLTGQAMQVFVSDGNGGTRNRWRISGNTSDLTLGNPHGSAMRFWRVRGLTVTGNRQPFKAGRNMVGATVSNSCDVSLSGNTYPGGVGQSRATGACPK
jgi:hypothetical protein